MRIISKGREQRVVVPSSTVSFGDAKLATLFLREEITKKTTKDLEKGNQEEIQSTGWIWGLFVFMLGGKAGSGISGGRGGGGGRIITT